ncbi:hypothetical protein [Ascidiimonas aurantiaca]|uniref:hypothetical protein n=1 Tax=Ascidiimonas aurantiaca TaxID=1685432 RepID=UPI0030EECC0B
MKKAICTCLFILLLIPYYARACTIFCGKAKNGHVWAGNNEDGAYTFDTYINVFPKTEDTQYGYYTLSYFSAKNGESGAIEGGMNEAGLFYDFNSIKRTSVKNIHTKQLFPEGDDRILNHILAHFKTVQEVIDFFDTYWFEMGFTSAQMHVADKYGNFGIIGPSGSRILKNSPYQISTNFDICGNEDSSACWRYPIIHEKLEQGETGLDLFTDICESTSLKGRYSNYTIYSNIQNLNTGEIWFFLTSDYDTPFKTSIKALLAKGRKSYRIQDLFKDHPIKILHDDYLEKGGAYTFQKYKSLNLPEERKKEIVSIFINAFLAKNYDVTLLPFLEEYLQFDPVGHWLRSLRATLYFQMGEKDKAISIIEDYKREVPETSMDVSGILNRFEGRYDENYNTTIALSGFRNARQVFVKGLPVAFNFLTKKDGKWTGKFHLDPGVYHYSFIVDGKEILSSTTPVKRVASSYEVGTFVLTHQVSVELSEEAYQTTVKVKVPHKEDIVYITGAQDNLGNWIPYYRLKKVSAYEREITLELHYPAKLKFLNANWKKEAVITHDGNSANGTSTVMLRDLKTENRVYRIEQWRDIPNKDD